MSNKPGDRLDLFTEATWEGFLQAGVEATGVS
jgi:hypothetical protein